MDIANDFESLDFQSLISKWNDGISSTTHTARICLREFGTAFDVGKEECDGAGRLHRGP
jgi:hypothetical protein